jgi:hypothetical protein
LAVPVTGRRPPIQRNPNLSVHGGQVSRKKGTKAERVVIAMLNDAEILRQEKARPAFRPRASKSKDPFLPAYIADFRSATAISKAIQTQIIIFILNGGRSYGVTIGKYSKDSRGTSPVGCGSELLSRGPSQGPASAPFQGAPLHLVQNLRPVAQGRRPRKLARDTARYRSLAPRCGREP